MKKVWTTAVFVVCMMLTSCTAYDNRDLKQRRTVTKENTEIIMPEEKSMDELISEAEEETDKIIENMSETAEEIIIEDGEITSLSEREIVLKSYKITSDNEFIEIELDYKNKGAEETAFAAASFEAAQDGVKLDFYGGKNYTSPISKNAEIPIVLKFKLRDADSDIEFKFYGLNTNNPAVYSLKIAE